MCTSRLYALLSTAVFKAQATRCRDEAIDGDSGDGAGGGGDGDTIEPSIGRTGGGSMGMARLDTLSRERSDVEMSAVNPLEQRKLRRRRRQSSATPNAGFDDADLELSMQRTESLDVFRMLMGFLAGLGAPFSWIVWYGLGIPYDPACRVLQSGHFAVNCIALATWFARRLAPPDAPIYEAELLFPLVMCLLQHAVLAMVHGFQMMGDYILASVMVSNEMERANRLELAKQPSFMDRCRSRISMGKRSIILQQRIKHEGYYRPVIARSWRHRARLARMNIKLPVFVAQPDGWRAATAAIVPQVGRPGGLSSVADLGCDMESMDLKGYHGDVGSYRHQLHDCGFNIPAARSSVKAGELPVSLKHGGISYVSLEVVADQLLYGGHLEPKSVAEKLMSAVRTHWRLLYLVLVGILGLITPVVFRYMLDCDWFRRMGRDTWTVAYALVVIANDVHAAMVAMLVICVETYAATLRAMTNLRRMLDRDQADKYQLPRLDFKNHDHVVAWAALRDYAFSALAPVMAVAETFVGLTFFVSIAWGGILVVEYTRAGGGSLAGMQQREFKFTLWYGSYIILELAIFLLAIVLTGAGSNSQTRSQLSKLSALEVQLQVVTRTQGLREDEYAPQLRLMQSLHRLMSGTAQTVKFVGLTLSPALLSGLAAPLSTFCASILPIIYTAIWQDVATAGCAAQNVTLSGAMG